MEQESVVIQEQGQESQIPAGETPAESAQPASQPTETDWNSDENPYRQQYTGLQGVFKQTRQEVEGLRQQLLEQIKANALLQAHSQGATPEELKTLAAGHDEKVKLAQAVQLLAERESQNMNMMQGLEPVYKRIAIENIAKQFGVSPDELMDAPTPDAAIYTAQKLSKSGKTRGNFQERKESGVDKAGSAGSGLVIRRMTSDEYFEAGLKEELARLQR